MLQVFDKISFITGNGDILAAMPALPALRVFDSKVKDFLSALSAVLLKFPDAKRHPDVVTLGFWCRKANLASLEKAYEGELRLGRGVAFHIAPSNVPVNFAYSLVTGMLAGNANVVRIPSKNFPQTEIICREINKLLPRFPDMASRLCLVRFEHDKDITDVLSSICMSRVIWGGDETTLEIRKSPLPARANEVTFPDRFSVCVINSDEYLSNCDKKLTAINFFNDTYLTDQNACTSPRIVFWLGTQTKQARSEFWAALEQEVGAYELQGVQTVNKLTSFYKYAAANECEFISCANHKITRVAVPKVTTAILDNLENSGYFYECDISDISDILPVCTRKLQTLSYIGISEEGLCKFIADNAPHGIDRIVPVGRTMDFALVWDGVDLIRTLSRNVIFTK